MQQFQITLPTFGRGFHLITKEIESGLTNLPEAGIVHIFILHTSAGLTINENYDADVRHDLDAAMSRIVPANHVYKHHDEGTDDMPAHIKSAIVGSSISIPVMQGKLKLGTWQGIYLCEFRDKPQSRKLVVTVIGK